MQIYVLKLYEKKILSFFLLGWQLASSFYENPNVFFDCSNITNHNLALNRLCKVYLGGARGVTVIIEGGKFGYPNSKTGRGCLHFT